MACCSIDRNGDRHADDLGDCLIGGEGWKVHGELKHCIAIPQQRRVIFAVGVLWLEEPIAGNVTSNLDVEASRGRVELHNLQKRATFRDRRGGRDAKQEVPFVFRVRVRAVGCRPGDIVRLDGVVRAVEIRRVHNVRDDAAPVSGGKPEEDVAVGVGDYAVGAVVGGEAFEDNGAAGNLIGYGDAAEGFSGGVGGGAAEEGEVEGAGAGAADFAEGAAGDGQGAGVAAGVVAAADGIRDGGGGVFAEEDGAAGNRDIAAGAVAAAADARGFGAAADKYLFVNDILRLSSLSDDEWKNEFVPYFNIEKLDYFAWEGEPKESRRLFVLRKK